MMRTIWAVVQDGKASPVEATELLEDARVLLTVLDDAERDFWLRASESSLDAIWDNAEADVYAELLAAAWPASLTNRPSSDRSERILPAA